MHDQDIIRLAPNDPRVGTARAAERRLFDHYGLSYTEQYVQLDEPCLRVRVLDVGSGPPVLLVPGGSGDGWQFTPLLARLKGWRYIVVNRPGGGLSDGIDHRRVDLRRVAVRTLEAVMDAFGLVRVPIVANSMGGLWAFWLSLDAPQRAELLVQLGCPALTLGTSAPFLMRLLAVPGINCLLIGQLQPKNVETALAGLRFQGSRPEVIAALPRVLAETAYAFFNLQTYRQSWLTLTATAMTPRGTKPVYRLDGEELRRVQQPVQLIWGDADPFGALNVAQQAARLLPGAALHTLAAGHLPHIDNAAACAQLIHPFLDTHASPHSECSQHQ